MKHLPFALGLLLFAASCGQKEQEQAPAPAPVAANLNVNEVLGIAIIEPAERIVQLAAEQSALIRKVHVQVGQSVKKGQILVSLDNGVENAQLIQAGSKVATQKTAVETARENLRLLQVKLKKAQDDLTRNESLFRGNALTQQALDDSRAAVADLQQQIRAQEATIKQEQTRIGELDADVRYYQTLNGQKVVTAPSNGVILSMDARTGQYLDARTPFGEFAPEGPVIALTEIDELFADKVLVGQKASIRPQGKTEVLTTGTVVLTSPYLRKKSLFSNTPGDLEDRRVREVRVQLDDPSKVLLGARMECLIDVQPK
jgi:multidrug resistance efflux pump